MKNLGIIVSLLGALTLILAFFLDWVDNNYILGLGIFLAAAGIVVHIFVNYKKPQYDAIK
jgi:hypothetical protein